MFELLTPRLRLRDLVEADTATISALSHVQAQERLGFLRTVSRMVMARKDS